MRSSTPTNPLLRGEKQLHDYQNCGKNPSQFEDFFGSTLTNHTCHTWMLLFLLTSWSRMWLNPWLVHNLSDHLTTRLYWPVRPYRSVSRSQQLLWWVQYYHYEVKQLPKLWKYNPNYLRAPLYLGFSHIHNVLVSLHTLHDIEAITVQHLGLCIARDHQEDITSDAVLQGLDLMAEDTNTHDTHEEDIWGKY